MGKSITQPSPCLSKVTSQSGGKLLGKSALVYVIPLPRGALCPLPSNISLNTSSLILHQIYTALLCLLLNFSLLQLQNYWCSQALLVETGLAVVVSASEM